MNNFNNPLNYSSPSFGSYSSPSFGSNSFGVSGSQSFQPLHHNKIMDNLGSFHGEVDSFGNINNVMGSTVGRVDSFNNIIDPLGSTIGKVKDNRIVGLDGSNTGLKIGPF